MDRMFDSPRRGRVSFLAVLAMLVAIVGAVNWGLVGLADYDLVAELCGPGTRLSRIVYGIVGLAGLYCLFLLPRAARS